MAPGVLKCGAVPTPHRRRAKKTSPSRPPTLDLFPARTSARSYRTLVLITGCPSSFSPSPPLAQRQELRLVGSDPHAIMVYATRLWFMLHNMACQTQSPGRASPLQGDDRVWFVWLPLPPRLLGSPAARSDPVDLQGAHASPVRLFGVVRTRLAGVQVVR